MFLIKLTPYGLFKSPLLYIFISKESEQVWASAGSGLVNSYPIFISIEDISSSPSDKSNNDIKLLIWGIAKSQFLSLASEKITLWTCFFY